MTSPKSDAPAAVPSTAAPGADTRIEALCEGLQPPLGLNGPSARLLEALAAETDATRGSLMVVDPATGRLMITAGIGIPEDLVGRPITPRPRSISEWVYRNRRSLILNGKVQDQRFESSAPQTGIESAMCLPLMGARSIVGVLNLARRTPAPVFSDADIARLATLVRPVGPAIERLERGMLAARLLHQVENGAGDPRQTLLPPGVTPVRDYEIGLSVVPGMRRGADLCERAAHDDGANTLLVADVPGDGLAAAVTSAFVHGLFVAGADHRRSISGLVSQINAELHSRFGGSRPAALWVARLGRSGEIVSCNAGGPAPFWIPADGGSIQRLGSGGPLAGALPRPAFDEEQLRLMPGDLIVAVSDGLLSVEDATGHAFGEERVAEWLVERRRDALDRIGQELCAAALAFCGRPAPPDDMVALALRYAPGS